MNSVTSSSWVIFTVLMIVYLLKDFIRGLKMIILSGKRGHGFLKRARFFIGGAVLCCITVYIAYALAIRNKAIATSQSELISNTVIVLLVSMIDDELFKLIDDNNPSWFKEIMNQNEGEN